MGKIIWVASYPRSGNTWVRAFLANLFGPGEGPRDLNNELCADISNRAWYDTVHRRPTNNLSAEELMRLRGDVQKAIAGTAPDSVFVKTHSWFGDQFRLPLIDPELTAGAIYVVRNPVDIAVSAAHYYSADLSAMVGRMADASFQTAPTKKRVAEYVSSWSQHVASWTWQRHPKITIIRYEDLCTAPEAVFAGIVNFLGLKPPPSQLARALRHSTFAALSQQERKHGFEERGTSASAFFRYGQPGEGFKALSPNLLQSIFDTHGEQMVRMGYASLTRPQ
jgi:hypothetical protein